MLTTKERSSLKSKCNTLKPIVSIGKSGLTENVLKEIEVGLFHNELIKVTVQKGCLDSALDLMRQVCEDLDCEPVQHLGGKFAVYKLSDKEDIEHILIKK